MANFSALKTAIQNAIKQNGNEEIAGNLLQQILLSVVNTMGDGAINTIEQNLSNETLARQNGDNTLQSNINAEALARGNADTQLQNAINAIKANIDNGYVYAGIAKPSTTPASGKVFYAALQAGTYTNFGGTAVTEGITILKYNGTSWLKEQVLFTDGGVFDISAYHATGGELAKYVDLTAALGTNGANVPGTIRKGGMSVKFVQSSDNKYIQARCMANEFTTDTTQWAIADVGVYVENTEFVYVKTDSEDKILYGVKTNGEFYFGAGCPQQVKDYIEKKISSLPLDEYEDIVSFLSDYLGSDTTLKVIIDGINATKLDKEGLDPDALETVQTVEDSEYAQVTTDSEDKILEGITSEGVKQVNLPIDTPSVKVEHTNSEEWLHAVLDDNGNVLAGIDKDGKLKSSVEIVTPKVSSEDVEIGKSGIDAIRHSLSSWNGKTLVWYGTSVPAGTPLPPPNNYPTIVANKLGSIIRNEAVGSSQARDAVVRNTFWGNWPIMLGRTVSEEIDMFRDCWNVDYTNRTVTEGSREMVQELNLANIPIVSTYEQAMDRLAWMIGYSYQIKLVCRYLVQSYEKNSYLETIFNGYENELAALMEEHEEIFESYDVDLFVFDHGLNDDAYPISNADPFESTPNAIDTTDISTWLGAMNTYMKLIMYYKPHVRVLQISHYEYGHVVEAQKQFTNRWAIPFCEVWNKLPLFRNKRFPIKVRGFWDSSRIWHDTGFYWIEPSNMDDTNISLYTNLYASDDELRSGGGYNARTIGALKNNINPRMENGIWVWDVYMNNLFMQDGLHPGSDASLVGINRYANIISQYIQKL